jgi:diacylglycerol kinase family enzyme
MEALGALAGSGVPVGIVPGGTGNLVARTLGIPLDGARAVRALLDGALAEVDLGTVAAAGEGGAARHFAFAAGVGIDARMIEATPAHWKRRLGVLAYAVTAARAVVERERFGVRVTVDGEVVEAEASAVMIVNFGAVLGDLFHFGPGIAHDDGLLDCCLFAPTSVADAARVMWRLARRDFGEDASLLYRPGRSFRIETDRPRAAQADGELLGHTPLDVAVVPRAATLLVPRPPA